MNSKNREYSKLLTKLYYDPETGLRSEQSLYRKAKAKDKTITHKIVKDFLNNQELHQIYSKTSKYQFYKPIMARTPNDYQIDLMFLTQYKYQNNGFHILFNAINMTSRFAYSIPLKNKRKGTILDAFKSFIKQAGEVKNVGLDLGSEFISKSFKDFARKNDIQLHFAQTGDKRRQGKIERFNRTIRTLIMKYLQTRKTTKWLNVLPSLIKNYNNSIHSSIGLAPAKVTDKDMKKILSDEFKETVEAESYIPFDIGDVVRILKTKAPFGKETSNFSKNLYTIVERDGNSFIVKNKKNGNTLKKQYKAYELKLVEEDDLNVLVPERPKNQPAKKKVQSTNTFRRRQRKEINIHHEGQLNEKGEVVRKKRELPKNKKRQRTIPHKDRIGKRISVFWDGLGWRSGIIKNYSFARQEWVITYDFLKNSSDPDVYEKLDGGGKVRWKYI